jgi:arylsulfatase A-like enzyme
MDLQSKEFLRFKENRIKLYDAALRYVDSQIEKLFELLVSYGFADSSLIVVTADHGENFWDRVDFERNFFYHPRNEFGIDHGASVFSELIDVPLIVRCPGKIDEGVFKKPVSLIDITPTVLHLSEVNLSMDFQGIDLFDDDFSNRIILSEDVHSGYEKKAVIKGKYKLIVSEGDDITLLFDIHNDPREKNNLTQENPKIVSTLKEHLPFSTAKGGKNIVIDGELAKRLQNLGYM